MTMEAENEMSEPIKLYRDGEVIETYAPSVAREWQKQGWSLTPDMMPNATPEDEQDDVPFDFAPEPEPEHWAADMINYVEPEPEPVKRKAGRPKKAQ